MKRRFSSVTAIVVCMIFVSCGLMAQNEKDSQGRKQGKWSKSYPNGQIQYEGQFKDDRETGTFTYYNQDGSIAQTIEYKSDTGHATAYYKNKKVMSRGTYVDRKKNGLWQYFTEKGRKIKEETFEMGVKNGEERLWDKQGNLLEKVNYENGVRQGECYQYMYSDGYCIYDVKEGKKNGRYTCYYESKKKKAEGNYVNDDKEGEWVFYSEDGQVLKRQIWKADRLQDELLSIKVRGVDSREVSVSQIAYFYPKGKQTFFVLTNGEKLSAFNQFEQVLMLVNEDTFIRLNKQNNLYANYAAIKGIEKDGEKEWIVVLEPDTGIKVRTDKDSRKAVESLFDKISE